MAKHANCDVPTVLCDENMHRYAALDPDRYTAQMRRAPHASRPEYCMHKHIAHARPVWRRLSLHSLQRINVYSVVFEMHFDLHFLVRSGFVFATHELCALRP